MNSASRITANGATGAAAVLLTLLFAATASAGPVEDFRYAGGLFNRGLPRDAADAFTDFLTRYPDHELAREARFWRAEAFRLAGRAEEARAAYTEILPAETQARRSQILLGRAECARAMGGHAAAARDFLAAAEMTGAAGHRLEAAASFLSAGETHEAIPLLSRLVSEGPETVTVWAGVELGRSLLGADTAAAARAFRAAARASRDPAWSLRVHLFAFSLHRSAGERDEAVAAAREASEAAARARGGSAPPSLLLLRGEEEARPHIPEIASALAEEGETETALLLLEGTREAEGLVVLLRLAREAGDLERTAAAAEVYAALLPPGPPRAEVFASRADALLALGRSREAAEAYLYIAREGDSRVARAALWNALVLLADDRPASEVLETRRELENGAMRILRADFALARGETEAAIGHLEAAEHLAGAGRETAIAAERRRADLLYASGRSEEAYRIYADLAARRADPVLLLALARCALEAQEISAAKAAYTRILAEFPGSGAAATARYGLAWTRSLLGEVAQARADLAALLAETDLPRALATPALRLACGLAVRAQDYAQAARLYDLLVAEGTPDAEALYGAGIAHLDAGHAARAVEILEALRAGHASSPFAHEALAPLCEAYARAGDARAAARAGERALHAAGVRGDTTVPDAIYAIAAGRAAGGDAEGALALFALLEGPRVRVQVAWIRLGRSDAFGAGQEFLAALDAGAAPSEIADGLLATARALAQDSHEVALSLLDRIPLQGPYGGWAALLAGRIREGRGETRAAEAAYRAAAGATEREIRAEASILLGDLLLAGGRPDQAARAYRESLATGLAETAPVTLALGVSLRLSGDETSAATVLAPLLAAPETFAAPARLERGFALLDLGRAREAAPLFASSRDYDPPRASYGEGMAALALGDTEAARRRFLRVVLSWPDAPYSVEALFAVGEIEIRAGRTREAREAFQDLLVRYPNSARAASAREALRHLAP